jgi:hypothetical protein
MTQTVATRGVVIRPTSSSAQSFGFDAPVTQRTAGPPFLPSRQERRANLSRRRVIRLGLNSVKALVIGSRPKTFAEPEVNYAVPPVGGLSIPPPTGRFSSEWPHSIGSPHLNVTKLMSRPARCRSCRIEWARERH